MRWLVAPTMAASVSVAAQELVWLWLARILYPQVFPEDLRPIVRDFYIRCYHQVPGDAQLDQLLRPAG
jgi:hypothetical protein